VRAARHTVLAAAFATVLAAAAGTGPAAQETRVAEEEITEKVICPCPDCSVKLLSTCFCGAAENAKTEIRALIAEGKSADEVLEAFIESAAKGRLAREGKTEVQIDALLQEPGAARKYGQWVLAAPEEKGFNLLGYWLPIGALLVGGVGVLFFLRRAVSRGRAHAGPPPPDRAAAAAPEDPYNERIRRELETLEG